MSTSSHATVVDIGLRLGEPATADLVPLLGAETCAWALLRLDPDAMWEDEHPGLERTFVVLEGLATFRTGDWRRTLASGFLLHVPAGEAVTVTVDGTEPLSALMVTTGGRDED